MKSRILLAALPLVLLLLFYPITKPLHAYLLSPGSNTTVSGDYIDRGIEFHVSTDYQALLTEENGKVSFDLGRVFSENGDTAFNSNARFVIGSSEKPVFTVTNNSDHNITVKVTDSENPGTILLNGNNNLAPGESARYYFAVNTSGGTGEIRAQLKISGTGH